MPEYRPEDGGQSERSKLVKGKRGGGRRAEDRRRRTEVRKGEFKIPVFIDSPLGFEITKLYSALDEFWDKEAKELKAKGDHQHYLTKLPYKVNL